MLRCVVAMSNYQKTRPSHTPCDIANSTVFRISIEESLYSSVELSYVSFSNALISGSGESIQSIHVHDKVIVSMAANNRIAWHTFTDKEVT